MTEFDPYGVTQAYTHQSVLALGAEILTKTLDHEEHERQRAIEDAVEQARKEGREEKDKALKKLTKHHNRVLKQNLTDLQARCNLQHEDALEENNKMWQEKLQNAVQFEKDYSDRRLEEQIAKTKEACKLDQVATLAKTRKEEEGKAIEQLVKLENKLKEEHAHDLQALKAQHLLELKDMEKKLSDVAEMKVKAAIEKTEKANLEKLSKVKLDHDAEISRYKAEVVQEQAVTDTVRKDLERETHARVKAEEKLAEVKEEFKYFINSLPGHEHSQYNAEYMLAR